MAEITKLGLETVPVLYSDRMVAWDSAGKSVIHPDVEREGITIMVEPAETHPDLGRIILKHKANSRV